MRTKSSGQTRFQWVFWRRHSHALAWRVKRGLSGAVVCRLSFSCLTYFPHQVRFGIESATSSWMHVSVINWSQCWKTRPLNLKTISQSQAEWDRGLPWVWCCSAQHAEQLNIIESKGHQMEEKQGFFDFAAEVGLTKHLGGLSATEELIEQCHIGEGKYVLDVGCGAGVTPCFIAKRCGCRVAGVDISEGMIKRSEERARREGVADKTEFRVADAQELPFEDDVFDAVITESVTSFPADKQRAVNEYVRVTKPGGYVGLNESTWLKTPTPPELVAWTSQNVGTNAKPLTSDGWAGLMESAGLRDITVRTFGINTQDEARGVLRRYGYRGMLGVVCRMLSLYPEVEPTGDS